VPAFLPPLDYPVGGRTLDMRTGDFNNDGRYDLVTTNSDTQAVSVLLGNADGTFQPARTSTNGGLFWAPLAVGDFNEDGKLDLATDHFDELSILLGQGDGTFALHGYVSFGLNQEQSLATGDLNADGKLDLVAMSRNGEQGINFVNVLLGDGDGNFSHVATYGPDYYLDTNRLALADFDGDHDLDLASDGWGVLLGNGDGTFQEPPGPGLGVAGSSLAVADFDADGKLDLATTRFSGGTVSVGLGNGDGTFQPAQSFAAGSDPRSVNAADVNGDGVLDLVVTDYVAGGLTVLLGDGAGSFGPPITTAAGSFATALVVADFNADGRPDAAVAHFDKVSVLLNDGDWSPDDPPTVSIRDATLTEGNAGTANATFTLTLSHATNVAVTVHYATADISATAGSDYTATSGVVIILAGQASATFTVAVTGDRLGEPNETFAVNLTSATNATVSDGQGVGTILDDEPRISISDVTKKEGKKNQTTVFTFTVTLSATYDQPVTLSFRTVNGTATTSDGDYVAKTGTLTFAPGETTKTITIEVKGDSKKEADETFYLDLFGNSINALFTKNRGIGTILNDD
jgi:hypothetical protein